MAVLVAEADLPQLLTWLEPHRPLCYKVYGELRSHLKGLIPDLQFFVDRWPHPQAVVGREDPEGTQMRCIQGEVSLFAVEEEALVSVLKEPGVVVWQQPVAFAAPYSLKPAVLAVAAEEGRAVTEVAVVLLRARSLDLQPIPIPEGLKVQPISDREIQTIYSTWEFNQHTSESYIQNCVQHYPSFCLATESGDHVGHMVGTSYGVMGMLYVSPQFRRKGYAKVIVSQLSQKYFAQGEDAYVTIQEENVSSQTLHRSLGFREASDVSFTFLVCDGYPVHGQGEP